MDPRERYESLTNTIGAALDGRQAEIWTAMPGFIVDYNATLQTCSVQIGVGIQLINPLNTDSPIFKNIPKLVDCPVVFPHGGGFTLTFPIQAGDECLVILASRCIDNWWYLGPTPGVNQNQPPQGDLRMHDLSDGFAMVGPRSRPNAISAVSTNAVQLRSDDGTTYIELDGTPAVTVVTPGDVSVTAGGPVSIVSAVSITLTAPPGTITANGRILG